MITLHDTSQCILRTRDGGLERRDTAIGGQRTALPSDLNGLARVQGPAQALMVYENEHVLSLNPDSLEPVMRIRASQAPLSALSASQDGQTLACLDLNGHMLIMHVPTGKRWRLPVGATNHDTLHVSPDGSWLAWGHIRDKGGGVRVWRLTPGGPVCMAHALDRRHVDDPTKAFDRPGHLRLSFNAYTVAVYASCAILTSEGTRGWRASIQCYDLAQGGLLWQAPLDANLTSDQRPLSEAVLDAKHGASGDLFLTKDNRKLYVASSSGLCCVLDARDGALERLLVAPTSMDVHCMALDSGDCLWLQSTHDALHPLHT